MAASNKPSTILVAVAFAAIYLIWGSTYFFIRVAVHDFPPMLMGACRFLTAGILLLIGCWIKGDPIRFNKELIVPAISGLLMLFVATGAVIWVECSLPSAMVAIMLSAEPIWFIILDKPNWKRNLKNRSTIGGLIIGFAGISLLFGEAIVKSVSSGAFHAQILAILLLIACSVAWCGGSLYSKKRGTNMPARLNTAWQMIFAGLAFIPASGINQEWSRFHFSQVTAEGWISLGYLILFGSIGAFSAYVWLLKVRTANQVGTHSYVNPVVAVILGVMFANETISGIQFWGLIVILVSVLLVSLSEYGLAGRTPLAQYPAESASYRSIFRRHRFFRFLRAQTPEITKLSTER